MRQGKLPRVLCYQTWIALTLFVAAVGYLLLTFSLIALGHLGVGTSCSPGCSAP